MLRKHSDQNSIVDSLLKDSGKPNYRKELAERVPEMKQAKKIEKDRSWAKEQGYDSTEFNNPMARSSSSVRPARCDSNGGITDIGGPTKQVGVTGKNSIWDSDVLANLAKTSSSKERIAEEKASSGRMRELKQAEYKQSMSPKLGEGEAEALEKKASTIHQSTSGSLNNKGWVPAHQLSIFDTNENFDRLTALNNRVSPKTEPEAPKVKVANAPSKAFSSKDASARFMDGILNQEEKTTNKSVHNDAVDRLYKVLSQRNTKE